MRASLLGLTLAMLLAITFPTRADEPRQPHPFAPSLPQLSDEEEAKIDAIIDRFILYDTGRLKGAEGKKALEDFQRLGSEATFALIRGANRSAAIESSCPAVVIAKKLNGILRATNDLELLEFARENIGAGVGESRHLGVLKDLRAVCIFRKSAVLRDQRTVALQTKNAPKTSKNMSLAELAQAVQNKRGADLKPILVELETRKGEQVVSSLALACVSYEPEIKELGRELLETHLTRQSAATLREKLKDKRSSVREIAAKVVGDKNVGLARELIVLIGDEDEEVRQAARASLVQLSKGIDHGPERGADTSVRNVALSQWRDWWTKNNRR